MKRSLIAIALSLTLFVGPIGASDKQPIKVEDCVAVRGIVADEVRTSSDGTHVAYIVKSANVQTNRNEFGLWLRDLSDRSTSNGALIFSSSEDLSGLTWVGGGKDVALLVGSPKRGSRIVLIHTEVPKPEVIVEEPLGIFEYSIDSAGDTVAYITYLHNAIAPSPLKDPVLAARGFDVPFGTYHDIVFQADTGHTKRQEIRILRRGASGQWESASVPSQTGAESAGTSGFLIPLALSLSPDGRYLAFGFVPDTLPVDWSGSCFVQRYQRSYGDNPVALGLYDIRASAFSGPVAFPNIFSPIRWSQDSSALVLPAAAPAGSKWEAADCASKRDISDYHLFAYDLETRTASEVLPAVRSSSDLDVMLWKHGNEDMTIRLPKENLFARMSRVGDEWKEVSRTGPGTKGSISSVTTYDGNAFVGIRQESAVPPDLFLFDTKSQQTFVLTDLNPEIKQLTFGQFESVEWTNRYGGKLSGNLILPVGYEQGKKYPLVIMLTWANKDFVCDGHYSTAFPPQPLANAGFLVLIFNIYDVSTPGASQPPGPPGIREAESMQASVESAIDYLTERGLADKNNVGIIGFSRSSWKVDYILTHSQYSFRAASSADGGAYIYGAYWIFGGGLRTKAYDAAYGGPPYGTTLQAWLQGAPPSNADKVRTPLLMEYTGGHYWSEPLGAYEFFTALNTLKKPVELFFYPNGDHPLDTPFERVASLQRNVDWFRFWMQNYAGATPDYDRDQYARWHKLRELHETDVNAMKKQSRTIIH